MQEADPAPYRAGIVSDAADLKAELDGLRVVLGSLDTKLDAVAVADMV